MRTAASTTDNDRRHLAYKSKMRQRMIGPEEWQRCPDHPRRWVSYRWTWPIDDGPESGDVEQMHQCSHPDHEREDD